MGNRLPASKLTKQEQRVIDLFRALSDQKKRAVMSILQSMSRYAERKSDEQ